MNHEKELSMRLTPWLLSLMLSAPLLATAGSALAESEPESDSGQHEPLDDAALEEKYGIKAGAVQRDDDAATADDADNADTQDETNTRTADSGNTANDDEESEEVESDGGEPVTAHNGDADSQETEGGTGGTGSAEDAIEAGEDEKSNDDNDGESEQDSNAKQ
ncbi:hypothetical protein B0H98_1166 [Vreelandella songnenensis]|uniref:Uncharacterized protein n=2 Tax=Vreelandella songnenensis TaxID=1176243 RepID=A0A2T0ULK9_9GAMM|nr:hypothetical protein B0H98_1166 [Halomonas songnenensis]